MCVHLHVHGLASSRQLFHSFAKAHPLPHVPAPVLTIHSLSADLFPQPRRQQRHLTGPAASDPRRHPPALLHLTYPSRHRQPLPTHHTRSLPVVSRHTHPSLI